MDFRTLVLRGLTHYWRTNLAVVLGVATAAAVLAGALLTGESVRASLRALALNRIGNTHHAVRSANLFSEPLARQLGNGVPVIALEGLVTHQQSGRRAHGVLVYGVDDRFWTFHGRSAAGLENREAAVTQALAAELGAAAGDTLLLRAEKLTDVPAESLFGRKEDSQAIRFTLKRVEEFAFALSPRQGDVKAIYVPLSRLQRDINAAGRANLVLLGPGQPAERLRTVFSLDDLGIRLRKIGGRWVQLDTRSGVIPESVENAASAAGRELGLTVQPAMTYLANALRVNGREIPYSLIAAVPMEEDAIVLGPWAARDLDARPGATLTLDYMLWHPGGQLTNEKTELRVGRPPLDGLPTDRDLAPEYPGITDASNVSDWDPPFPMDLGKIRPRDEDYWDRYRTTPKAFLPLARAQQLWSSRWGKVTTLRFAPPSLQDEALDKALQELRLRLKASIDPLANGFTVIPVRDQSLSSSRGATDFGEYFVYFSFFLVVSALLLAGLFFRLGIEQRHAEIGLLRATGFPAARVLKLFLAEGLALSAAGGLLGILGAVAYAGFVLLGLRTWWIGAVGTRDLALHVSPMALAGGVLGAVAAAGVAIWLSVRSIRRMGPRSLLSGAGPGEGTGVRARSRSRRVALAAGGLGVLLLIASATGLIPAAAGFFGAGSLLLIAALAGFRAALAASLQTLVSSSAAFAFRNAGHRPGRTVLTAALIASATFLVVSVESFRKGSDTGGEAAAWPLLAESVRPVYYDLNAAASRQSLNLPPDPDLKFLQFRLRPGDDASCLNLYAPENPRVLGAPAGFLKEIDGDLINDAIPAAGDANSLAYVLHKKVGDEITLSNGVKLRIAAALHDSAFQSELLIAERHFLRAFSSEQGYRVFLISAPRGRLAALPGELEKSLADHGFDVVSTAERIASFHRVENTYLSTFQSLGALGLLLGTVGLGAVLFRNVLERRRELALLAASGWSRSARLSLVLRENLVLLLAGLACGVAAAVLAIAPVLAKRGASFSVLSIAGMLVVVLAVGALAAALASRWAMRESVTGSLRAG
ncbi:MAG: FtsX-like permease family protein [Acidobacteria bacterium]|nr:FtsX-like permease family protein [Acidobacteriota bacterium]